MPSEARAKQQKAGKDRERRCGARAHADSPVLSRMLRISINLTWQEKQTAHGGRPFSVRAPSSRFLAPVQNESRFFFRSPAAARARAHAKRRNNEREDFEELEIALDSPLDRELSRIWIEGKADRAFFRC